MNQQPIRTAILLAAGAGSKFWPYNVVRNKTAFPIANVPIIRRLVDQLPGLGISQAIVVVEPGEASVRAALRGCIASVQFVRQPVASGTADALLCAAQGLTEDFLVLAGDIVTAQSNLSRLLAHFAAHRPLATALITPLNTPDHRERSEDWLIAFAEQGQLHGVEGHSRDGDFRFCGVYAMQPAALPYLRDNPGLLRVPVGGMPPLEAEIVQSLQLMVDEGQPVLTIETDGYFVDVDKPWHILAANQQVIQALCASSMANHIPATCRIHDGAEINGHLVLGDHCEIGNRVVIKGDLWLGDHSRILNGAILDGPTVIGAQTLVQNYCQIGGHSALGPRGHYGHGAEFSGVALETVYCYHYCEIWGVVGAAVDFGAATVCGNLRFDDSASSWRIKGRAETPNHAANAAYFGDYMRTGVNAIIMPGRRLGVYSVVGPGVVLYDDLPDRQIVMLKQELTARPWGPERYGW